LSVNSESCWFLLYRFDDFASSETPIPNSAQTLNSATVFVKH